jgi:hypothetical protein
MPDEEDVQDFWERLRTSGITRTQWIQAWLNSGL